MLWRAASALDLKAPRGMVRHLRASATSATSPHSFITHDLQLLDRFWPVFAMRCGAIVAQGTPATCSVTTYFDILRRRHIRAAKLRPHVRVVRSVRICDLRLLIFEFRWKQGFIVQTLFALTCGSSNLKFELSTLLSAHSVQDVCRRHELPSEECFGSQIANRKSQI